MSRYVAGSWSSTSRDAFNRAMDAPYPGRTRPIFAGASPIWPRLALSLNGLVAPFEKRPVLSRRDARCIDGPPEESRGSSRLAFDPTPAPQRQYTQNG